MAKKGFKFRQVHNVLLMVIGPDGIAQEEWTPWLDFLRATFPGKTPLLPLMVLSLGGAPTATQRAEAAEVVGDRPTITALVTDSLFARGAGTAYSWISRQPMKFFSPAHLRDGLAFLKAAAEVHPALELSLAEMRKLVLEKS